jgi:hypothetical protein
MLRGHLGAFVVADRHCAMGLGDGPMSLAPGTCARGKAHGGGVGNQPVELELIPGHVWLPVGGVEPVEEPGVVEVLGDPVDPDPLEVAGVDVAAVDVPELEVPELDVPVEPEPVVVVYPVLGVEDPAA